MEAARRGPKRQRIAKLICPEVSTCYSCGMGKPCDEWTGYVDPDGYGRAVLNRKTMGAHRAIWISENGEIPCGMMVLHRCHNRKCVEISHLYLGDHKQNMEDRAMSGRNRSGHDRLNQETAAEVRNLCRTKTQREAAAILGLPKSVIGDVMSGKCWKI